MQATSGLGAEASKVLAGKGFFVVLGISSLFFSSWVFEIAMFT